MNREEVVRTLAAAAAIDRDFRVFGASKHKYRLNAPLSVDLVRAAEEKYGFTLPEDYFRFITEIGDGGAGEDYGLYSFGDFIGKPLYPAIEDSRRKLSEPFAVRPMTAEDNESSGLADGYFEQNREKCFFDPRCLDDDPDSDFDGLPTGFLAIMTRGCQYDVGLALNGEHRGKVFDIDYEGSFILTANSFEEFYQSWLDKISNHEWLKAQIEFWENIGRR